MLIRGAMSLAERCVFAKPAAGEGRARPPAGARRAAVDGQNLDFHLKQPCGRTAYPSLTGQRFCGSFSISELDGHPRCTDATRPVCVAKPGKGGGLNSSFLWRKLPTRYRYEAPFAPYSFIQASFATAKAYQLFAGGHDSGATFHFHMSAYNVLIFGTKEWMLTPPRFTGISGSGALEWRESTDKPFPRGMPLRCTQGPGDMLLVPAQWGHATVNRRFTLGIGDLFCDIFAMNASGGIWCDKGVTSLGPDRARKDILEYRRRLKTSFARRVRMWSKIDLI